MQGHPQSKKTRQKISKSTKGKFKNEKAWNWKGDKVSYNVLHRWVEKRLGKPGICEHCGKSRLKGNFIHWANKSRKYLRELTDWIRLCASCHLKYDYTEERKNKLKLAMLGNKNQSRRQLKLNK